MRLNSVLKWIRFAKDKIDAALSVYLVARAPSVFTCLDLKTTDCVLEVGCGVGQWTIRAAPKVKLIVALDVNFNAVSQARCATLLRGQRNAAFIVADAMHLPFMNGSFSKVFCIDVIEHITDDKKAIDEIARVLNYGGRVVVTTLLESRRSYIRKVIFNDHIREYSLEMLYTLFQDSGLTIVATFGFYRRFSTIAREVAEILHRKRIDQIHGMSFLSALILATIARLDFLSKTPPGGCGVVAEKRYLKE